MHLRKNSMKRVKYSFVIPVYNEEESLRLLVANVENFLLSHKQSGEMIFIDDGSTDESFQLLETLKQKISTPITVIKFRKNLGKSAALSVGFDQAVGEIIITLDADLQDDPSEIPLLIQKLGEGNDFVVGWRKDRNDKKSKIRLSHIFNTVVSKFSGVKLHDMNCGLKVMRKEVAKEIELYGELHRYIPVLAHARGFRVAEVPVLHHERKFGKSKYGSERMLRAAFDLVTTVFITSFKTRPMHMFGFSGVVVGSVGLIPLVYLTILHFTGVSIIRRPLLLFGIMMVLCAVQLFSTGLLAELLVNLHGKRDHYPVEKVIS